MALQPHLLVTTINSAELIKHASNSFLALKISYANVIADLCEKIGADVEEVTQAMGLDPRIGGQFLRAGLGFGGFCFPKDLQAFVHLAGTVGVDFEILKAAERVNKQRIDRFLEKVHQALWVVKGSALPSSASRSKPTPTTFASRPLWRSPGGCTRKVLTFTPPIPKPSRERKPSCRKLPTTTTPTTLCATPKQS